MSFQIGDVLWWAEQDAYEYVIDIDSYNIHTTLTAEPLEYTHYYTFITSSMRPELKTDK